MVTGWQQRARWTEVPFTPGLQVGNISLYVLFFASFFHLDFSSCSYLVLLATGCPQPNLTLGHFFLLRFHATCMPPMLFWSCLVFATLLSYPALCLCPQVLLFTCALLTSPSCVSFLKLTSLLPGMHLYFLGASLEPGNSVLICWQRSSGVGWQWLLGSPSGPGLAL